MMDVTTNQREILYIEKSRPMVAMRKAAGHIDVVQYYKGKRSEQEWGVEIAPSSIHQAFLLWSTIHKLFIQDGIGYDKYIMNVSPQRVVTVQIFYRRPTMAGVTTEMYYDGKPIFTKYYERNQGNHPALLRDEGAE